MPLIRPATVLSFLLLIAFGCLLVSILSAPIVKRIALATNNNVTFGVFGYCTGDAQVCTGITLGYNVDSLSAPQDFTLPSKARLTLTNLLIIHPIGALLVVILLVLTIVSHFYGPGHSPGYLLFLVLFSIFTCVVAILAFLVDILLFVPHLAAGGYIVVGAPITLAIVVIGLCATRRRVVGKQERKRRIAETANTNHIDTSSQRGLATDHGPTGDGGIDSPEGKLSEYAAFEVGKTTSDGPGLDETGERIPLNPRHQSPPPGVTLNRTPTNNSQGDHGQSVGGSSSNNVMGSRLPLRGANPFNARPLPPTHRLPLSNRNNQGVGAFDSYVPPRAQWTTSNDQSADTHVWQGRNTASMRSSPPPVSRHPPPPGPIPPSSERQIAIELAANVAPPTPIKSSRLSASNYYEDVDPRFAESTQNTDFSNVTGDEGMPAMLVPGYNPQGRSRSPAQFHRPNYGHLQNNPNAEHGYPPRPQIGGQQYVPYAQGRPTFPEYDPPPQSPALSEQTNFGISQRSVNPRWQPPPGQQPPARGPLRNMPLLSGNPDFELPTLPQTRGGPRGRDPGAIPPGLGSDRGGRYPLPPPNMPR